MRTAWTFPGHGSQSPGMGRQLLEDFPKARRVLGLAQELSGLPLNSFRERGPTHELLRPSVAEPLITAISIGYVDLLFSLGMRPDAVAGYSAGELVAYYVSGVFDLETVLRVATIRGRIFENYVSDDHRMVAIAGVGFRHVDLVLAEHQAKGKQVYLAARNAPNHTTIVGKDIDVLEAEAELIRLGAEVSLVNVSGRWHSKHLAEASQDLISELSKIRFSRPMIPVFTSFSGDEQTEPSKLRHDLAFGVSHPVMWHSIVENLVQSGVQRFIECGSGRVLFGLMRWNNILSESICVEDRNGGLLPLKKFATSEIYKIQG